MGEKSSAFFFKITSVSCIIGVTNERGDNMQDFMLKIPVDLHRKVKVFSAISGITMREFILEAVKEKVNMMNEKEAIKRS